MLISALLTSAGINIAICAVLLSLYSILRKQPINSRVYFGQRLSQLRSNCVDHFSFERYVPSPGWLVKAWKASEEEILACGGVDAVAFLRIVVLSIRLFSIAAIVCILVVLPLNYFGKEMHHRHIPREDLDVFTIGNVKEGSKSLWAHCIALYIITCSACVLLHIEYKKITDMRLSHIVESSMKPSLFTVLVRGIPWSPKQSYSDTVRNFFTKNHISGYLSHQMVYKCGAIQKLMDEAVKIYEVIASNSKDRRFRTHLIKCGFCWGVTRFSVLAGEESVGGESDIVDQDLREKECPAALVFFKSRYAATLAAHTLQSKNPMLWVTDLAPEPHDIYWKNLSIPYRQIWIRRLVTLLASIAFMILFIVPVTLVQGLLHLDGLQRKTSVFRGVIKNKFINDLATGYLPSVILMLFLYIVPPTMMLLSTIEGHFSRSGRKKSACSKILYFWIWNVFFVNVLSGKFIERVALVSSPKDITAQLATLVPTLGTFFVTYVLTSGWASLSVELMQPFPLLCNLFYKFILRKDDPSCGTLSFPYHTEIPRVLLFGVLGLVYSIMAPLMLPFLLIYFCLAYLVYRNQILNVYVTPYQSGGKFWPLIHNTFIFSLVLTQVIAIGVFGLKKSTLASAFTFPLIIFTLLFSEYCRQRFHPIFKDNVAEILIEMDRKDEENGKMDEIHKQLHSAYCQFASTTPELGKKTVVPIKHCDFIESDRSREINDTKPGTTSISVSELPPHSSLEIEELDLQLEIALRNHIQRRSHS